jgi:hypothetical protein
MSGRQREQESRETLKGSASMLAISQPDAALYIRVPTLATTVAIQTTLSALAEPIRLLRNVLGEELSGPITWQLLDSRNELGERLLDGVRRLNDRVLPHGPAL